MTATVLSDPLFAKNWMVCSDGPKVDVLALLATAPKPDDGGAPQGWKSWPGCCPVCCRYRFTLKAGCVGVVWGRCTCRGVPQAPSVDGGPVGVCVCC